jgi:hypothetical protein
LTELYERQQREGRYKMAWITPKTDWDTNDGIGSADLNRIEGNTDYLKTDLATTESEIYESINATNPWGLIWYATGGVLPSASSGEFAALTPIAVTWAIYISGGFVASRGGYDQFFTFGNNIDAGLTCEVALKSTGHIVFYNIGGDAQGKPFRLAIGYNVVT